MKLLGKYRNGNFMTTIYSDGTLVRETEDDEFVPAFASNMDIKIMDYCNMGCTYCHEGSSTTGRHGDILNEAFIDTLHPYQEVAIGGGDATSHPDLIPFLQKLKEKKAITNMTVNQAHFEEKQDLIELLVKEELIHGIGISLVHPTEEFISLVQQYPNAVIHVINGVFRPTDARLLSNKKLKLLILGYKKLRRGKEWYDRDEPIITARQIWLKENIHQLCNSFASISFDNLAIEQLEMQSQLSKEDWELFYMGDDSEFTYFIDMVERKFSKNSTSPLDERYELLDSVDDMFEKVRLKKR